MRVEFLQSIDFNQMLVYSTFVHLLFLTVVMYLPSPRIEEQIVVPTFRLDLIELPPTTKISASTTEKKKEVVTPPVKKRVAHKPKPITKIQKREKIKPLALKPKAKQLPLPKPVIKTPEAKLLSPSKPMPEELKINKKVLEDLEALQSSVPKKSILQELDEVARTSPKPRAKKVIPPKLMQEETFKEIEKKKVQELPIKSEQAKVLPLVDGSEVEAQERELAELLKESDRITQLTPVTQEKKEVFTKPTKLKQTTASDLIKELEAMENKKTFSVDVPVEQKQPEELNPVSAFKGSVEKPLMSVAEKFEELEESSQEVRVDVSQDRMIRREFKTVIERGEVPVLDVDPGPETSNVLSTYVGKVYKRVYSKWKTPLGIKAKKVVVAFTIFRNGNIDKPVIRESAGDENLDSIAVRAILDAVPFPMLPEELRRPNLRTNITFKYVPAKK